MQTGVQTGYMGDELGYRPGTWVTATRHLSSRGAPTNRELGRSKSCTAPRARWTANSPRIGPPKSSLFSLFWRFGVLAVQSQGVPLGWSRIAHELNRALRADRAAREKSRAVRCVAGLGAPPLAGGKGEA